jgi:mono/diheme cytochrome c family protein
MGRTILGMILGVVLGLGALLAWARWGKPPVAVADPPLPMERWAARMALHSRIERELPDGVPIPADEANLVAGARIYRNQCATCHGFHGKPSAFGTNMFPAAPPLWEKHEKSDVVGVSDDPPGETFWKVANGIRLTGMPAYRGALPDTQIWQVTLLLANANKPLPPEAVEIIRGDQPLLPDQEPPAPKP